MVLPVHLLATDPSFPGSITRDMIAGLDTDGRIVIDQWGARTSTTSPSGGRAFMFGLTLCCNASDKGTEHGVVCRSCFSSAESGNYLFREPDGSFPGLDPIDHIEG